MLKILAATVEVAPTNLSGVMMPAWTPTVVEGKYYSADTKYFPAPLSQMTDILSSSPLTPLGILVKSWRPMAFCLEVKVQLSVPVHWRSPLCRYCRYYIDAIDTIDNIYTNLASSSMRYLGVSVSSLRGGAIT